MMSWTRAILLLLACLAAYSCAPALKPPRPDADGAKGDGAVAPAVDTAAIVEPPVKRAPAPEDTSAEARALTPASRMMIKACNNYLAVNPTSEKHPDVLSIKASVYYNNKLYERSREVYKKLMADHPKSPESLNGIRMVAQSYYEEKEFDQAQEWFGKMRDAADEGSGDKQEAIARIAESIYKSAQRYEEQQQYKEAAAQYERVALEFPQAKIADVALHNAGLAYEKLAEWSHAILCYQKLFQTYGQSRLLGKTRFRTAKCYEKLLQWDNAGEMYLRVVSTDPRAKLAPTALYNAGFCFENAGKLVEAAMTMEKLAHLYPKSEDVADVLFKAGDLYGKLKDWQSVSRVNEEFTRRFGNDKDRIVQALCMVGVALFMQDRHADARIQLLRAVEMFRGLKSPSDANRYYAANAQYTLAEISHEHMKSIMLMRPESAYRRLLKEKTKSLDEALKLYSKVLDFGVLEWTTRSIYQMGQAHEDFGLAVLKQERPSSLSFENNFALELGIAQALDEYLVTNSLHYHEQNVKLGIKEKLDNKHVAASRKKLTYLPFMAARNYLELTTIFTSAQAGDQVEGFALIAHKLENLQRVAPFQERAMELFLKVLEMGVTFEQTDDFYNQSSSLITQTALNAGNTYGEVAAIAREAPVPPSFDAYEKFVYMTKLLGQIEEYETVAFEYYLKSAKIAEAYKIDDEQVRSAKEQMARLLFTRGRCYDLLAIEAFTVPPFPEGVDEVEREEYKAQFDDAGLQLQDRAIGIYRTVLDYARQNYAAGDYVTHAYVRLYQHAPEEYGIKREKVASRSFGSGRQWKCAEKEEEGWYRLDFDDKNWSKVHPAKGTQVSGFPDSVPMPMWHGEGNPKQTDTYAPAPEVLFRRTFFLTEPPNTAALYVAAHGRSAVYLNETALPVDTMPNWTEARQWDLGGMIRKGKNLLAIAVARDGTGGYGLYPYLVAEVRGHEYLPQPPGHESPMDPKEVQEDIYKFEFIKNFSIESKEASR